MYRNTGNVSPEWIQRSDFVKLRELSLSMDVPERFVACRRVVGAAARPQPEGVDEIRRGGPGGELSTEAGTSFASTPTPRR